MSSDLVVFAKERSHLATVQEQTIGWLDGKLNQEQTELAEIEANVQIAVENGWAVDGWNRQHRMVRRKIEYYEKMKAAINAGYVIIPNFPIDVFAVRTKRNYPVKQYHNSTSKWSDADRTQNSESPALGEGKYVSDAVTMETWEHTDSENKTHYQKWSSDFREVDFPIKAVRPVIVEETSRALALKVFDEIGVLPERRSKADPMIIGRINFKQNGRDRTVSFLIAWWLRESDIAV